ncbi:FdhF/YdeP family oxidoreductase [Lutibacter maritimus]|uniref:Oxidoreductase alpha (Molybdopterin) subunit n=1 Tax=Lutibacter maritimus TaxID=593133 RepID=A0A1I6RJT9_9FLAO|nr:FdhF/YdeP family oxidoreductase [Lutibacter maritimus]SFS64860.1 oxidoreductase alpha (molybdopterin) subunit [Lutibacter maritimus]
MKTSKELKIGNPPKSVAGFKAITISIQQILQRMPFLKALKVLNKLNQKNGTDCPGCAWPDPKHRSKLGEFCENGIKAIAEEAMEAKASPEIFAKYSIKQLQEQSDYWLGQQGRLTHPMIIRPNETHYSPISWDEANKLISKELNALENPNEAIFYTSGRTSNEAAFLYQLFVRMYGTNNLPDCSNMCHESSGAALSKTVGIGKGSVTLNDLYKAELILIFGQNPATNHPRMLVALEKAKKNGAKIVTINPLIEAGLLHFKNPQTIKGISGIGTEISDLYLQIQINEDVALLKAVLIKLFEKATLQPDIIDQDFIQQKTAGFDEFKKDLLSNNLQELIVRTGLSEKDIDALVDLIADHKKIITCWGMGLTQHVNAVDNIQEIVNLLLVKGSIGKEGAGTCPVRGHSNVQGDRTMGIAERPSKKLLDKISENFGFTPPKEHGYSVVDAIAAMHQKKAKVFIAMGGNFLSAAPDTHFTSAALSNCNLTVHISTKLNRSHLAHGKTGIILPSMGRTDVFEVNGKPQFITVENSMGVVHSSKGTLQPPSKFVESEPIIVANIAKATLKNSKVDWDFLVSDYNNIRDLIGKTIAGFDNYNEKIKNPIGFELPNGARVGDFNTPNKKANFTINKLRNEEKLADEFIMMTIRSHDQFNTTIYGLNDRYRGIYNGRMVVFMNAQDMLKKGLKKGNKVTLFNNYNHKKREVSNFTVVPYNIPKGCVATYFPEANPLVPLELIAHTSYTPSSKSVCVKII